MIPPTHLFYTKFIPENQPVRGTIIILHGMMEHSGRYMELADFLCRNGYFVVTYDHIGHGRTAKNDSEQGFMHISVPQEKIVNDAVAMAQFTKNQYPDLPNFILGHSMGSFITRCVLLKEKIKFNGVILTGTGARSFEAFLAKGLVNIMNFLAPKHRSSLLDKMFSDTNNRHFKNEANDKNTNWLSVNKENRKAFLNDPLCGIPFTNNGYYTLLSVNLKATVNNWSRKLDRNLPLLFLSGKDDPIGNFGKGIEKTISSLKSQGFRNITYKLYPGMRHEILNEDIKLDVYDEIIQWLNKLT